MNRVNKFRAFDDGRMIYPSLEGHGKITSGWILNNYSNVMQFTGLTDKNGIEIYEGDIVKRVYVPIGSNPKIIEYYYIGLIVWDYKGFAVQWKIEGALILDETKKLSHHFTKREIYKHPTAGINWIDKQQSFETLTKLGNIHENKELLK